MLHDRYTTTISCLIRHMLHDRYTATISCLIRQCNTTGTQQPSAALSDTCYMIDTQQPSAALSDTCYMIDTQQPSAALSDTCYMTYTATISCLIRHMLHDRYTATISCLIRHITWQIHSNQQLPDQTHLLYDRYTATHSRPNNWTWISLFFKNISTCICLLLEKGVYPENLHVYLCCPINISILINLFCVRILFRMLLLALNFVSDFFFLQLFYQTHLGCGKYTAAS